jgi:hypothetical protein
VAEPFMGHGSAGESAPPALFREQIDHERGVNVVIVVAAFGVSCLIVVTTGIYRACNEPLQRAQIFYSTFCFLYLFFFGGKELRTAPQLLTRGDVCCRGGVLVGERAEAVLFSVKVYLRFPFSILSMVTDTAVARGLGFFIVRDVCSVRRSVGLPLPGEELSDGPCGLHRN